MRTLLSTRLFESRALDQETLGFARRSGFLSLELFATPGHFDPFTPGAAEDASQLLRQLGMYAPWVHLDRPILAELHRRDRLVALTSALIALEAKVLSVPKRPWGSQTQPGPDLREIQLHAEQAGARLAVGFSTAAERFLQHPPRGVALCWDLALPPATVEEDRELVERVVHHVERRHLQGIRIAALEGRHREPPAEREARLLEAAWPHLVPGTLVYDVEDPSGGSPVEIRRILQDLHAFHSGERRPPDGTGGGLFWAGVAPG